MRQLAVDIGVKKYDNVSMECLSMGMSDDYADAIASQSLGEETVYTPNPDNFAVYDKNFGIYSKLYQTLKPLYDELNGVY